MIIFFKYCITFYFFTGNKYTCKNTLYAHMRLHTKLKLFHCPHCPKYYVFSRSYDVHLRTHTGERPYLCEDCGIKFISLFTYKSHKARFLGKPHHDPRDTNMI